MNNSHFVSRIRWSRYTTRKRHNASMVSHMELTHRATSHKYIRKEGQLCGLLLLFWLHHHCCNCSSWHLLMALHFLMASHPWHMGGLWLNFAVCCCCFGYTTTAATAPPGISSWHCISSWHLIHATTNRSSAIQVSLNRPGVYSIGC